MYSQCPECLTRFRVPAAALRAAHGTVRCGRCGSAFDALPRLSDTLQVDGPASALGEPVPPGATSAGGLEGATAVGLLSADEGSGGPEFHFSADDIEQVFVDVRDWQSRFGAASSPGDRAGLMGDTSSAELVGFLKAGETGEEDEPEHDANDPPVWVHEPESVEDITLEGERIQIERGEGFNGLEEDFLEREIEREIEEQHLAEITGSHRSLSGSEVAVVPEVAAVDSIEPADDDRVNPTQAVAAESVNPEPAVAESAEPIAPLETMPAAVAATAAAIAVESTATVAPSWQRGQPWHRRRHAGVVRPNLNRMTRSRSATTIAGSWTIWPQPPTTAVRAGPGASAHWCWRCCSPCSSHITTACSSRAARRSAPRCARSTRVSACRCRRTGTSLHSSCASGAPTNLHPPPPAR